MMILTDIATVPLSTAGAKDERGGGGEVAEGGKSDHQGGYPDYIGHDYLGPDLASDYLDDYDGHGC